MDQSTSVQPQAGKSHAEGQQQPNAATPTPTTTEKVEQTRQTKDGDDDDDEESDLDDLDEVLDDFSKPAAKQKEPENDTAQQQSTSSTANAGIEGSEDFDEATFMKQLEQDMANMMGQAQQESGTKDSKDFQDTVENGADAFAKQLEESGIPPGDFLKQLLTEVMNEPASGDGDGDKKDTSSNANTAATGSAAESQNQNQNQNPASFTDVVNRTMNRMQESGDKATAAASEDDPESDEAILQLLKALEAGASGAGGDEDLQKMLMGFMEKVSSKEVLYEPMKELDGKFEPWIAEKQAKNELTEEDVKRYQTQSRIVRDVVGKLEEEGYSDEDSKAREWVWERMQEMQNVGNPPDELIPNPLGGNPLGGMGDMNPDMLPPECAQQ